MKWPKRVVLIRHDTSAYNVLRAKKEADPLYQKFMAAFEKRSKSEETKKLAIRLWKKYQLDCSDANTPLVDAEATQAFLTGQQIKKFLPLPDVILYSPYIRAKHTLDGLIRG